MTEPILEPPPRQPGDEDDYRNEWAALTGRSPSEIYVPEAIRTSGE